MQKRRLSDRKAVRSLDHITNRINAISLAHHQLSPEHGLRAVNVAVYLQALCAPIEHQLEGITINVEADDVDLLIHRTVPLGLVVNEAVTNSAKHAFNGATGSVAVGSSPAWDGARRGCLSQTMARASIHHARQAPARD